MTGAIELMFIAWGNHSLSLGGILSFEFPEVKIDKETT